VSTNALPLATGVFHDTNGIGGKMIPGRYIDRMDFDKLTKEEARVFVIFELKEKMRHQEDIAKIRKDIREVCKIHGIDGMELIGLYSVVEGEK